MFTWRGGGPRFASELPRWQAGRQDISAPSYFQNANALTRAHARTHRGSISFKPARSSCRQGSRRTMEGRSCLLLFFFLLFFVKSSDKHLNPTEGQSRDGQTDGQTGTVRFALSLTDLMRGTLSRVQHKVGPLCKCSSSSHDWLYNLERQTCMNTCARTHRHTIFRGCRNQGRS